MTVSRALLLTAVLMLGWCLSAGGVSADEPSDRVTIRGETRTIWPSSDLRERGYDVPDIPRDQNAAWTYIEAINAFTELPDDLGEVFDHTLKHGWPKTVAGRPDTAGKKLKVWITGPGNRRAMELARQASRKESCLFPSFGDSSGSVLAVLLPNLGHQRFLAKMLVADGKRLEAEGKYPQALDNYVTVCRMGSHSAQGITLIDALVGVACWALGDQAVRDMALRRDLPPALLEQVLQRTAELAGNRPTIRRGMDMEKVTGLQLVDEFVTSPSRLLSNLQSLGSDFYFTDSAANVRAKHGWPALEARIGRLMFPDRTMKKHMSGFYDELIRRAELPGYEADWNGDWEEKLVLEIPRWNILARMFLPSLARASMLAERLRAASQMTQVVAALRLYAARHQGAVPERLDDLADMLDDPEVLIDPLSGSQFVYQLEGKGWLLYSLGENLVDDGGREGKRPWELDYVCRYPASERERFTE